MTSWLFTRATAPAPTVPQVQLVLVAPDPVREQEPVLKGDWDGNTTPPPIGIASTPSTITSLKEPEPEIESDHCFTTYLIWATNPFRWLWSWITCE